MSQAQTMTRLVGRDSEIERLRQHVASGGRLLVDGDAGVGKTALLEATEREARDSGISVLSTAGVEPEARLPYAGLHTLLESRLTETHVLPPGQAQALTSALGLTVGPRPNPFLIGLGALEVIKASSPVLVIADDVDLLDDASRNVLAFVARRLPESGIALVAASRGESHGLDWPQLRIEPLDAEASEALVLSCADELEPAGLRRVLDAALGNPLALIELAKIQAHDRESGAPLLDPQLPSALAKSFAGRTGELTNVTRTLLLAAALDDELALGEILLTGARLHGTRSTADDLLPAVDARQIDLDDTALRFRHPLTAAALRQTAQFVERQEVHAAIAAVVSDPDRSARHEAAATVHPDEALAARLTEAAARARARGDACAALAALEHATRLSTSDAARDARMLRAADAALELGRHDVVGPMVDSIYGPGLDSVDRGRLAWIRAAAEGTAWSQPATVDEVVPLAEAVADGGDVPAALTLLANAAQGLWRAGAAPSDGGSAIAAAADRLAAGAERERVLGIRAMAAPREHGSDVIKALNEHGADLAADPDALRLAGVGLMALGAFDRARPLLTAARNGLQAQRRYGLLTNALVSLAWTELYLGVPAIARTTAADAAISAREAALPGPAALAQLAEASALGVLGQSDTAIELIMAAERAVVPSGARFAHALAQVARGSAALGAAEHERAFLELRRIYDPSDAAYHEGVGIWTWFDLAEAAAHSGRHEEARAIASRLEPAAVASASPMLRIGIQCAAPLLADDETAGALFERALAIDIASFPFTRARLLLAYGAWLRRQRRASDSRSPLHAARDAFDAISAFAWGARARQELRASGETTRGRLTLERDDLSPQELEIAHMAAEGLTNRQIGQRLCLSHRTVGAHLYRAFPKLGISSRVEIASRLAAMSQAPGLETAA